MSVSQWIMLTLAVVVTAWGFASVVSVRRYAITPRGMAVALAMPLAWAALITLPPWGAWLAALQVRIPDLLGPVSTLTFLGIPWAGILFVATNIMWIQASLTGDWSIIRDMMPRRRP